VCGASKEVSYLSLPHARPPKSFITGGDRGPAVLRLATTASSALFAYTSGSYQDFVFEEKKLLAQLNEGSSCAFTSSLGSLST
jgi:hypothetical protein